MYRSRLLVTYLAIASVTLRPSQTQNLQFSVEYVEVASVAVAEMGL